MDRITKSLVGQRVIFHGHDGKNYPAVVSKVHKGIATVNYYAYVGGLNRRAVTAYVDDPARLSAT